MAEFSFSSTTNTTIADNGLTTVNYSVYWTGTAVTTSFGLNDLTHTYPDDLDMLLVGPGTGRNFLFMSDAGSGGDLVNADFSFSDNWAILLADNAQLAPGNYLPTNHDTGEPAETPADFSIVDPLNTAGPVGGDTFASSFGGMQIAGQWSLRIRDDFGPDSGTLGGYTQTFTTVENFTQINGTGLGDIFQVFSTSATTGTFALFGNPNVAYSGLNLIIFDGGAGADFFYGGQGAETVIDNDGFNGDFYRADYYGAGNGDTIDYSGVTFSGLDAAYIDLISGLAFQGAFSDTIVGFENVEGSQGAENIIGNGLANILHGNNGADWLDGGDGVDQLFGDNGDDTIAMDFHSANDAGETLDGGLNTDTLLIYDGLTVNFRDDTVLSFERLQFGGGASPASRAVQFNAAQIGPGLSATAAIIGTGVNDISETIEIYMAGQTTLNISAWTITGFNAYDRIDIIGGTAAETIHASATKDIVFAGGGADHVFGGGGSDWLFGGTGADELAGGSSADWFAFDGATSNSGDVVNDYAASDFLYFGGTSAAPVFSAAAGNVTVNGVQLSGAAAGDVTVYVQASTTLLQSTSADFANSLVTLGVSYLGAFGAYTRFVFDADNNAVWRVIQDGMTAANLLDYRWTYNDAGNAVHSTFADFDQANANPWTSITNYYSAANVLDYRWTINDVGQTHQSLFTDWDQASTNTWTSRINYYTAPGVLDVQWTYNDAGQFHAQLFTDWDQANANTWSYRINYYTAPGVLDYQWTYNDAGNPIHSINTDWDQTSVATWSYRQTYYSALNVADYQWTFNDAGNPIHSTMYDWDQGNTATWTNRTTYYSAANVADYQWTFYDAGQPYHSQYVDWDQANVETWAYHVINFSAPGVVANDYYV